MTDTLPSSPLVTAPRFAHEADRLEALRRYHILDTPPETAFDRITALAARLFNVPIATICLVDESRVWFKSRHRFDLQEMQRQGTFWEFACLQDQVFAVSDLQQDDRFPCNLVEQSLPNLRFYAGAPLLTPEGFNLGALCLLDTKPGIALTDEQQATLTDLAAMVIDELELRLAARRVRQIDAALLEVTQGVAAVTGEAFFLALVQYFTKVLGVDYACISLLSEDDPEVVETIAFCNREQIIDNVAYVLQGTPCLEVVRQQVLCCYPRGVQRLFPEDTFLTVLDIEGYAAIPFFDSGGTALGLLGIMNGKPLENVQLIEALLPIFSLQVAAELERQQVEIARQQAQSNLEDLVAQRTAELSETNTRLQLEIAERQQTQAALQQEQEVLKVLLDNVQAGIVACDAEGWLTLFNRVARELHGLAEQPLPPEQWAEQYNLYQPNGKTLLCKEEVPLFRALQGEVVDNVEIVIAPKQGEAKTLLASGQAIVNAEGEKQGAVVVMHDITERKQAEAERVRLIRQQIREQSARLKAETDQQRSAFLAEISTVLASSLDYEQTLASVANLVVPFFADWCAIDLLQDQQLHRVAVAHCDPEKVKFAWELHQKYPNPMDAQQGVPKVLRTGQSEMVDEIPDSLLVAAAQDQRHLQILRELNLKSYIVSPLIARGQILGAIVMVAAESGRRYGAADLTLAEDIAHRAATAIDNARLYRNAQQAQQTAEGFANRTHVLQQITAALSQALTPQQVAEVVMQQGVAALGASAGSIVLLVEPGTLKVLQAVGYPESMVDQWASFAITDPLPLAEMARTREPLFMDIGEAFGAKYPHLIDSITITGNRAIACLPLEVEGRLIGGMGLSFAEPQAFSPEDRAFMLTLAQQCAQAIARAHLYEAERTARSSAEAANRVKDEFLAVLSHELRSPLNPILGWVKLLRSGRLDATKTAQALETIERNAKLQTQLIEDLLDVSRILQGKLSLNMAPVNLEATIQAALETVQLAAEAKLIHIHTQYDPEMGQVLGDAARLQQIVWNLLTNAVKFNSPKGRVEIRLTRTGSHAQLQIYDTGKGIAPEFLPHMFEYFRQADSTTTRKFGGLGLGLAIVKHLVELHGGMVWAESAGEGQGATFTVQLPLLSDKKHPNETSFQQLSPSMAELLQGVRVLLVDDEADTRELIAFILEQAGAIVRVAQSAGEAFKLFSQARPDVIVSDIGMPEIDGYMLMRQIRNLPPEQGGQVPAIALTAYAAEHDQQQALAAGFQAHQTKPVEPEAVVRTIANLLTS
ncbi:MAG: hypothetical protein Kow00121_33700 [Elainellaceae cyanobacterium]